MTPEEKKLLNDIAYRLDNLEHSDRYTFSKHIEIADGRAILPGSTLGLRIGTIGSHAIGFYGQTPIHQQGTVTAPSGGITQDTEARSAITTIIARLANLGLIAF